LSGWAFLDFVQAMMDSAVEVMQWIYPYLYAHIILI
jgi:hypothetical protein